MTQPTLSIITVNFNNNKGLIATLNSIKNQSFTSYEHIIIDACSTDGSKETIIKYSKKLLIWPTGYQKKTVEYTME
jgi:putative colanic acid biosynthesis glycosyltransferase